MQSHTIYYLAQAGCLYMGPFFSLEQAFQRKANLPLGMQPFTSVVKSKIQTEPVE